MSLACYGFEWFIYNRTPAYEYLSRLFDIEGVNRKVSMETSSSSSFNWTIFLPIAISLIKGAIIIGNTHTTSIIVANFRSASGFYELSRVRKNRADFYNFDVVTFQLRSRKILFASEVKKTKG